MLYNERKQARYKGTNKLLAVGLLIAALMAVNPSVTADPITRNTQARAKHLSARTAQAQHRLNALLTIADISGPRGSPDFFRFRSLLAQGADPNTPRNVAGDHPAGKNKTTWLIWFSALGDAPTVQALLYYGAKVNARGYGIGHLPGSSAIDHSTALIIACGRGDNWDVIQLLLRHGAKVNVHDISGRTPLAVAEWQSNRDECALLRQCGASEKYMLKWQRKLRAQEIIDGG